MRDEDFDATRELRRDFALPVIACRMDDTRHTVVVTDISRHGCQLKTETAFEVDEMITLKHEVLGDLSGQVRWSCAGRVGLQFVRPI
jgi:hypothetical protein